MGCAVKVVELIDRCAALGQKIEDALSLKIRELSHKMAKEILEDPKVHNITEVVRKHVLSIGADIASAALNDMAQTLEVENRTRPKGQRQRTLATILGPVAYEREAFYDAINKSLSFPADEALGVRDGQLQPDILSRMVRTGIEMPFAEAAELCESLMGVKISEGSVYNAVVTAGEKAKYEDVVPSKEEIHKKLDCLKETNPGEKVHIVVGVDGAMEPLRPQGSKRKGQRGECYWKECKGFRAFAVVGDKTLEQLASWHQIGTDDELGQYLKSLAASLSGRPEPLVIAADGAKWIWAQVASAFGSHIEVLDWYHAVEHLSQFADIQFGKEKERRHEWLEKSKARLMGDEVAGIIHGLARMNYKSAQAKAAASTLIGYLETNKNRMKYGTLCKQGLTIGSGGMESANKSVSHIRLKRNGCWWKPTHANEILRLRCAKANGTLDRILSGCWKESF